MELLEYENEIFTDCFQEDGLLVMAKYDHKILIIKTIETQVLLFRKFPH